jgi:hypothetical protein
MADQANTDQANTDQANGQYAALERLYSERRWAEVEEHAAVLLAQIEGGVDGLGDGTGDGAGDGDLRCRVLLLLGHTRLYGFNDAGVAAELYRRVLGAEPEALLLGIAQEGLNQCLATAEPSTLKEPSPADAMPWLEQIAVPEVAAQEQPQSFPGFAQPVETSESLANNEAPTEISKAPDQPSQPTQPTQLSPKESAELAKGLLGVVIRPN